MDSEEAFVVRVDSTDGLRYFLSDRRLVREQAGAMRELFRYENIQAAHWMFHDLRARLRQAPGDAEHLKHNYFDRLEIELPAEVVVMEGLSQAYSTMLNFFWWMTRTKRASSESSESGPVS